MKPVFQARQAFILYVILLACFAGLYFAGLEFGSGADTLPSPSSSAKKAGAPSGVPTSAAPVEVYDDLESLASGEGKVPEEGQEGLSPNGTQGAESSGGGLANAAASQPAPAVDRPVREGASTPVQTERAASEPVATRESSSGDRYTIQVAAHSNRQEAEQTLLRLEDKQFIGRIRSPQGPGDSYYRVWVGEFGSREEAQLMENQLKAAGFLTYLRKVE